MIAYQKAALTFLFLVGLIFPFIALAQNDPAPDLNPLTPLQPQSQSTSYDDLPALEHEKRGALEQRLTVFGSDLLGDQIDPHTGGITFETTDVSLPGNFDIPVSVTRRISQGNHYHRTVSVEFGDWQIVTPRIQALARDGHDWSGNRCSNTFHQSFPPQSIGSKVWYSDDYTNGMKMEIPGQGTKDVLEVQHNDAALWPSGAEMVTTDGWYLSCGSANSGQGFIGHAPDGTEYRFDRFMTILADDMGSRNFGGAIMTRKRNILAATRITDIHGNTVDYNYDSFNRLTSIIASDGRRIDLSYSGASKLISSVTTNPGSSDARTWTYAYAQKTIPESPLSSGAIVSSLVAVTQPDGQSWSYDLGGMAADPGIDAGCPQNSQTLTVTHPYGASGTFQLGETRHRNSFNIQEPDVDGCPGGISPGGVPQFVLQLSRVMSVQSKTLNAPNASQQVWTYGYEADPGPAGTSSADRTNTTTVTEPTGRQIVYRHYWGAETYGGKLASREVKQGGTVLSRTDYEYEQEPQYGHPLMATNTIPPSLHKPTHMNEKVISQDGDSYTTEMTINTNRASSAYSWGKPTQTRVFSNVSTTQRVTDMTYEYNTANWIMGLLKTVTQNGRQLATYSYDTKGQKISQTRYGQNWATFNYNADGTLNWMRDALNRQITPSQWKRGKSQRVDLADNTFTEQVVDDNGWIMSQTDQLNRTDNYTRDTMGRLTVSDPHGSWDNTNISYNFSGGGAIQTITKGQSKTTITYDGLFRPILEYNQALDTGWGAYINRTYDGLGRTTFESQPSLSSVETKGVNTTYDALGRVLTVAETVSPYATTTHSYHSGHRHRITDPSGAWKDYYSYGYEGPNNQDYKQIDENGLRHTLINDNIYGQTTSVVQHGSMGGVSVNATQYFYYDNNQRLCRYRGLEGGDTLYNYNAAGELTSYQKGLSAGANCATPTGTGAVNLIYDPMGRLLTTDYVNGGAPDITRSYDAVGNLLTTNRSFVSWTYSYNDADLLVTENLQTEGRSYSLAYNYNTAGHMTHRTNPNGFQIAYAPDGLGRATKAQYQSLSYASGASYHPNGAISAFSYGNGFNFSQLLNARQLPSTISAINGSTKALDQSYVYDGRAKITSLTDNADIGNNRSYGYDALGQMTSASGPWGSMAASYDSLGNLLSRNIGSRQINMSYDSTQRLSSYTDSAGSNKDLSYDSRGNVTEMKVPFSGNCIEQRSLTYQSSPNATLWTHDAFVNVCTGEATLYANSYNPNITPSSETYTFSYIPAGATQTVSKYTTINANGQQVLVIVEATTSTTGSLSMRHRIQRPDGSYSGWVDHGSINFGPLGSPTHPDDITFTYDYSDQPVQVSGKASVVYRYDGNFKRVKSASNGQAIFTIYNRAGELVHVDDLTTGDKTDYVRLNGRTVARVENKTTPTYVHGDYLGSPVSRSNTAGTLLPRERYTPFGITLNNPSDLNNQAGFTGHIKDSATGLNYMQARYYDPIIGRFLSIDPVTFMDTGDPRYFNRYAYVANDPINMIDPTGMYGRGPDGGGFTDDEWNKFDAAQQQASKDIGTALGTLDAAKNGNADAISAFQDTFGSDGDLNTNIDTVADALTGIKSALDDDGSNYQAFGNKFLNEAANGDTPGTQIEVGTNRSDFGNNAMFRGRLIHEGAHNIGLDHPKSPTGGGFKATPYRYGPKNSMRQAYKNMKTLNPTATFSNPDHLRSFVYP